MIPKLFQQLYERRSRYPLGVSSAANHDNMHDIKYIYDEIEQQSGSDFLFLLLLNEHLDKLQLKNVREYLEANFNMVGVFGVGDILYPVTSVKFTLYVFSKSKPQKIWFGELLDGNHPFRSSKIRAVSRLSSSDMLEVPYGELESYFGKYLESIDLAIHGDKKDDYIHSAYRLFGVVIDRLQYRTSVDFYKPELIEAEAKLAHEEVVRLGDIAEIIRPKETPGDQELYSISLKDAGYPLKSDMLRPVRESARVSLVKRNDIVTNTFLRGAFLNLTRRPDLAIANTQLIIRIKDVRFTPAYLAVYLNSERMKAYFTRHKRGATIQQMLVKDLQEFEVVLPNDQTNHAAEELLSSLNDFDNEKSKLRAINKTLFKDVSAPSKPLQNELLAELHQQLQSSKNSLIRDLFDVDLREIEKCYKANAYKACLVLCGSLLEALVLDWLSEVEGKDYFSEPEITELRHLITKLHKANALTVHEQQFANEIRKRRNLIHPKNYIVNTPIHKEICEEVMQKLRPLVAKRYNYRKEFNT